MEHGDGRGDGGGRAGRSTPTSSATIVPTSTAVALASAGAAPIAMGSDRSLLVTSSTGPAMCRHTACRQCLGTAMGARLRAEHCLAERQSMSLSISVHRHLAPLWL